jgi:ribosomal protein L44E
LYKNLYKPLPASDFMKLPKTTKRYCPYCNEVTEQKIKQVSSGHKKATLKRGSKIRAKLRGRNRGMGNHGKYSKPAASKFKRKTKTTKKTNLMYTCSKCNKSKQQKRGRRVSKVVIE